MKKIYFLILLIAVVSLGTAEAKKLRLVGYQGEIRAGYSKGVGANPTINKWGFHTIHGIRISQYFSIGVGSGFDLYTNLEDGDGYIPIFINVKGYMPVSKMVRLFLSLDYGWTNNLTSTIIEPGPDFRGNDNDIKRFYTVEVGASIKISGKKAMNFGVGYDLHRRDCNYDRRYTRRNNSMIVFRVGFQF